MEKIKIHEPISWYTQDTRRRIVIGEYRDVYMTDDQGNTWKEPCYSGLGRFGGKDYFELLSEMNGGPSSRDHGIQLAEDYSTLFSNVRFPSLTDTPGTYWGGRPPEIYLESTESVTGDLEDYDDSEYYDDDEGDYNY